MADGAAVVAEVAAVDQAGAHAPAAVRGHLAALDLPVAPGPRVARVRAAAAPRSAEIAQVVAPVPVRAVRDLAPVKADEQAAKRGPPATVPSRAAVESVLDSWAKDD